MNLFERAVTHLLFPITFGGAFACTAWGLARGFEPGIVVGAVAVGVALTVAIFERIHPAHSQWNRSRQDVGPDFIHLGVSDILLPRVVEVGLVALLTQVSAKGAGTLGFGIWPTGWPAIAQVALALLVSQFPGYWWHRLAHTVPLLWRFHVVHHSPERLYWMNAGRFHPVDTLVSYGITMGTLLALGAPREALVYMSIWVAAHGLFQHCNIHLRLGPLNWIFSMAELHRWHHSLNVDEANANYGNNILFWDIVFGTVHWPRDRDASEEIGVSGLPGFPRDYIGQLAVPFRWKRVTGSKN